MTATGQLRRCCCLTNTKQPRAAGLAFDQAGGRSPNKWIPARWPGLNHIRFLEDKHGSFEAE